MVLTIRRSESAKPKHLVVDGIDVNRLSTQELYGLLDAEDEKFTGNLGEYMAPKYAKIRFKSEVSVKGVQYNISQAIFRLGKKATSCIFFRKTGILM